MSRANLDAKRLLFIRSVEKTIWGVPASEALPREIEERGATRVFIVASGTLSRKTEVVDRVASALGKRYAGRFDAALETNPSMAIFSERLRTRSAVLATASRIHWASCSTS